MKGYSVQPRRRGLITLVVLVTLVAATLIALASLQRVAQQSRQNQWQGYRTQAALLAESGVELAQTKLSSDPRYTGETWQLPADSTWLNEPGEVTIEVAAESDERRRIRVQVILGETAPRQARETLELSISLSDPEQDL